MTKQHVLGSYLDGHVTVVFCKVCSAEGEKLLIDCPGKIIDNDKNNLDEKKLSAK